MPLSKEREEQLTNWVIRELWELYPKDLSEGIKGRRGRLMKYVLRDAPDEEEQNRIIANLKAQIAFDRKKKKAGGTVYRWPHASTWWNDKGWDDEIDGSHADLNEKIAAATATCKTEGCEEEVIGPRYDQCPDCFAKEHDPWLEHRKRHLEEKGLLPHPGESKPAYYKRLRDWYREHLSSSNIGKS